ncbi:pyroglutamyl-peptidase I [Neobacillus mesonae]|nr:pyroglutamyl-peptidase I [Neobacillus mesonae]
MNRKVLLTGFDPFGGERINPALEAVKQLNGKKINNVELVAYEIPTVFHKSIQHAITAIEQEKPDVVICIGQAGGRTQITPERIAINMDDARIPDNEQQQPIDQPIVHNGPAAYFSTLPIKKMTEEIKAAGIPAAVSNSAGTFVCNHLFYGLMHYLQYHAPHIRGGFIHIPYLPEQALNTSAPSLSLDLIAKGLEIAAFTAAIAEEDVKVGGGSLH